MQKTILCFGDSNTWGFVPVTRERYPRDVRWPGVLANELGSAFHIIEEGLNGRTTVFDDPIMEKRCGRDYLLPCLESHRPIDLFILMLGTNDMKHRFAATAYDIARGIAVLLDIVRRSGAARHTLLIAPPRLGPLTQLAEMFEGAEQKSARLSAHYRSVAEEFGCAFFDASTIAASSPLDGIHLEPEAHGVLGRRVAEAVKELFAAASVTA